LRDVGDGPETITSQDEVLRVRRLGRKVFLSAIASSIVATAAFVIMP
jgi:hypothetical protein